MKLLYRVVVIVICAVACYLLIRFPIAQNAEEALSVIADPVLSRFEEHVGGFSREHINERQKLIYDALFESIEQSLSSVNIPVSGYSSSDIEAALLALLYDNSQFFWMDFSECSFSIDGGGITIFFSYLYSGERLERMKTQLDSAVNEIIKLVGEKGFSSEYDTAVFVHDYIAALCEYDRSLSTPDMHTAYGALVARKAVCDGYSHAFRMIMQKLSIECHYVPGEAQGPNGIEGHAWNIVKLDGVYTSIDLTWNDMDSYIFENISAGDDVTSHTFFGLSEEELRKTHKVDVNFPYQLPKAVDYNWFEKYGISGSTVESIAESAADMLIGNLERTTPYVEIKLTDKLAFQEFMESYNGGIIDAANVKLSDHGRKERFLEEMSCFVTNADRGCILVVGAFDFVDD